MKRNPADSTWLQGQHHVVLAGVTREVHACLVTSLVSLLRRLLSRLSHDFSRSTNLPVLSWNKNILIRSTAGLAYI
jgi:hypothetical protein